MNPQNEKTGRCLLDSKQIGQLFGITARRVNQLVQAGEIEPIQEEPKRLFDGCSVVEWHTRRQREQIRDEMKEEIEKLNGEKNILNHRINAFLDQAVQAEKKLKEAGKKNEKEIRQWKSAFFDLETKLLIEQNRTQLLKTENERKADRIRELESQIQSLKENA